MCAVIYHHHPVRADWATAHAQLISTNLVSTRNPTQARGNIQVKLGFVAPSNAFSLVDYGDIFAELVKRSRPSLVSAPPVSILYQISSSARCRASSVCL